MPLAAPVTRQTLPCSDGPILSEKKCHWYFVALRMTDPFGLKWCSMFDMFKVQGFQGFVCEMKYFLEYFLYFIETLLISEINAWFGLEENFQTSSVFWDTTVDIWMSPKSLANSFQYEHICFKGTQSMNINCSCLVRVSDPIQYFIWTNIINHSWRSEVIIVQKDSFWCDPGCSGEWVHTPWEGSRKDKAFIWTTIFYMTC